MNDFDYDAMQKKCLARNNFAKKRGARSKKCTLPGDYLTAAEKRKLSTTLVSANLKAPMDWATFKALPTEIKREYLEWLISAYGARQSWVAKDLFGISKEAFRQYVNTHEPTLAGVFPLSGRFKAEQRERWLAFVNGETPEETPPDESDLPEDMLEYCEQDVKATQEIQPTALLPELKPSHLTATYTGELYADDLNAIFYRLLKDRPCKSITIDITF